MPKPPKKMVHRPKPPKLVPPTSGGLPKTPRPVPRGKIKSQPVKRKRVR